MVFVVYQGVAVGDLAGARGRVVLVAGHGQRVAFRSGDGLVGTLVTGNHAGDVRAAHGQAVHAIERGEGETAGGGFRIGARVAAVWQSAFVNDGADLAQRRIGGVKIEDFRRQTRWQSRRRLRRIEGRFR